MRAICLFSGGKDSTVALVWAIGRYSEVIALSFDYPTRPTLERAASRDIANRLGVKHVEIDLPFLAVASEIARLGAGPPQTEAAYSPMRNLIFHSIALAVAEQHRAGAVVAGHIHSDGTAYRDATSEYLERIYSIANSGTYPFGGQPAAHIYLSLPVIDEADAQIIALGRELGAPLELSWSCLVDGTEPCGQCVSCKDRSNALK
jgi:7-cyano-7-deazaguanine synthase